MNFQINPLRLNVGFMVKQSVGDSRDFVFNYPATRIGTDFDLPFLKGSAHISRTPQGLLVEAHLLSAMEMECGRCLDLFQQPVETTFTELFAFNDRSVTDSGLILPRDGVVDLNPIAREYLLLEVPITPICKPDCKGLCPICGENQNNITCDHRDDDIDIRLEVLKDLLND